MNNTACKRRKLLFPVLFFLGAAVLFGQQDETETADYRIDESGRILQRISWTRANAYYYEVEIEKLSGNGEWIPEAKERTAELFIETSLAPGMYRYRVHNYNVLERIAASSEWKGIRVFVAREPKVERTEPPSYNVEIMAKEFSLVLIGSGLMDEAQIFMTGRPGQDRIMPLSIKYSEDETSVELVFPASELVQGSYDITVINPGGFRTVYHGFRSGFRQAVDINISLGYAPVIPLYGYLFNTYSSPFYPAGFYGRAQVIPYKQSWGFIGAELTPQLGIMKTKTGSHTVDGTMMGFALDAVYQWWFNKRIMALNFRLGGGLVGIFGIKFAHADGSASRSVATILPVVNAGVSFEWIIWRNLFIDAGFEYAQTFSSHSPPPGFIRISAGAGWRF